ncbi:hypothetical protein JCM8547_001718 [Rhodosporidiobolus lusitaniae]
MPPPAPTISRRATELRDRNAANPLLGAMGKMFGNQYSESNPDGVINAGMAENSLMHPWLTAFFERQGSLKFEHTDLTYGQSIAGSDRLLAALSAFYSRYFDPLTPVNREHICTSNGLSSTIEHLASCISDPGDSWIIPTPYYNGFTEDLGATAKVDIVAVPIPEGEHGETGEVEALEAELARRRQEGGSKVTAILVTSPHNPLGFCYKPSTLHAYCSLAERWNLYLIIDEIYALSVFDSFDMPDPHPFVSILSLDVKNEAGCSPSRIIQLYGLSKDFGANGMRGGNLVTRNKELMGAIMATAFPMKMGSPTDILWSALLNSPDLPTYLSSNRRALSRAYLYLSSWLKAQDIPYRPTHAGHFILSDWRKHVRKVKVEEQDEEREAEGPSKKQEIAFLSKLVDAGVYVGPGFSYAVSEGYGFFRITFSIRREELELALERMEKTAGLPFLAKELSRQYPIEP